MINKKGQSGKVGLLILIIVALVLAGILVLIGVSNHRSDMKNDVTFIERLKFVNQTEIPNATIVENCNNLYSESKPQTYFLQMYGCLFDEISLEKVEVTIAYENLTRELLDSQCECTEEGRNNCKIYKCGEMSVWGN